MALYPPEVPVGVVLTFNWINFLYVFFFMRRVLCEPPFTKKLLFLWPVMARFLPSTPPSEDPRFTFPDFFFHLRVRTARKGLTPLRFPYGPPVLSGIHPFSSPFSVIFGRAYLPQLCSLWYDSGLSSLDRCIFLNGTPRFLLDRGLRNFPPLCYFILSCFFFWIRGFISVSGGARLGGGHLVGRS